jgi:acyl-CoA dehydrogenase
MELTEKQRQLREEISQFAEEHLRADFMKHTREPAFPHKAYKLVCERGYMGFMLPKEYGGSGGGVTEY